DVRDRSAKGDWGRSALDPGLDDACPPAARRRGGGRGQGRAPVPGAGRDEGQLLLALPRPRGTQEGRGGPLVRRDAGRPERDGVPRGPATARAHQDHGHAARRRPVVERRARAAGLGAQRRAGGRDDRGQRAARLRPRPGRARAARSRQPQRPHARRSADLRRHRLRARPAVAAEADTGGHRRPGELPVQRDRGAPPL
ncbi:MAG: Transcriptional regulator, AcrR family, partial [uncultured Nocardioidaceae bacterium]